MSEEKRYYWIKLKTDFFDLETIDWLKSQENGCEYIVLYQQLCLMTANKDGEMASRIGEMLVPFDAKKIARDTKIDIDTVLVALELFARIGLIYLQENGIFRIPAVAEMVGSESAWAEKKRRQRDKKEDISGTLSLDCPVNCPTEIENRDKSKDIRDKNSDSEPDKESSCFPPSREEVESFAKAECLGKVNLDKFFDYYNANGWMVGKNPMRDWKAVLRNWNRNEKDKGVHKFAPEGRDLAYLEK